MLKQIILITIKTQKIMLKISELTAKLAELPQMKEAKEVANELASDDKAKTWSNVITNITVRNNNEDGKAFFNITLKNKVFGLVPNGQDALGNTTYGIGWSNYINVSITDVVLALAESPELALYANKDYLLAETAIDANSNVKFLNANILLAGGKIELCQEAVNAGDEYVSSFNGGKCTIKKDNVINHIIKLELGPKAKIITGE